MLAISLLTVLLALPELATAGPFTFPAQPSLRHVTLTAQDGRHLVLTITQTQTSTTTATQTPTTLLAPTGPRRTGRPGETELELRDDIFAPTTPSDSSSDSSPESDSSASSSSSSSSSSLTGDDGGDESASGSSPEAPAQVQTIARAQTTPPPPKNDPWVASALAQQGYSQVTYYTCKTRDATLTHCGWHVPVVKASSAAGGQNRGGIGRIVAAVAATLGVVLGRLII